LTAYSTSPFVNFKSGYYTTHLFVHEGRRKESNSNSIQYAGFKPLY
jgi:hypothetical protein